MNKEAEAYPLSCDATSVDVGRLCPCTNKNVSFPDLRALDFISLPKSNAQVGAPRSRVLCYLMTAAKELNKTVAVMETWGSRCERILIFSDSAHAYRAHAASWTRADIVVLDDVPHSYTALVAKHKAVLKYLAGKYLSQYDWFFKADDDSFVVVENLRRHLAQVQTAHTGTPLLVGTLYKISAMVITNETVRSTFMRHTQQDTVLSFAQGGATFAMNAGLLGAMVGILDTERCPGDIEAEDVTIGICAGWFTNGTVTSFPYLFNNAEPWALLPPAYVPNLISWHHIAPEVMRLLHSYLYSPPLARPPILRAAHTAQVPPLSDPDPDPDPDPCRPLSTIVYLFQHLSTLVNLYQPS